MKHIIPLLLLFLSSLLGAQIYAPLLPSAEDSIDILIFKGCDTLGQIVMEWQLPATSSTTETFSEYLGSGVIPDSLTWHGPINTWEPYISCLHVGSSATYYPVVISDFLKVEEVVDSTGISYHFQCNEDVSDIIHEPCYALRNVPFLLSCDYPGMDTLRLRFDPTIRLDWARELATMAAMTYFYPVWVSRK